MRGVLRVSRVMQDRAGQAVGGVEVIVGQTQECLGALGRLLGHGGPDVCHLDDLGRSPHNDMTIERGKIFTGRPRPTTHVTLRLQP